MIDPAADCGYRVLHGHLHLASALSRSNEVFVDVQGKGQVKVCRTDSGFLVASDDRRLPLFRE